MAILAECPGCRETFTLPEHLQGKKLRCKKCQQIFVATAAAAKPPRTTSPITAAVPRFPREAARPPARKSRADEPERRRSPALPWIVGGAVAAAAALVTMAGVVGWMG